MKEAADASRPPPNRTCTKRRRPRFAGANSSPPPRGTPVASNTCMAVFPLCAETIALLVLFRQPADMSRELGDVVFAELAVESRHLVLAFGDDLSQLGIRLLLHF